LVDKARKVPGFRMIRQEGDNDAIKAPDGQRKKAATHEHQQRAFRQRKENPRKGLREKIAQQVGQS